MMRFKTFLAIQTGRKSETASSRHKGLKPRPRKPTILQTARNYIFTVCTGEMLTPKALKASADLPAAGE